MVAVDKIDGVKRGCLPTVLLEVKSKTIALVDRIYKIAQEVFYFLIPSARQNFEVILMSESKEDQAYGDLQIAQEFLRKNLSYKFNPVLTYAYINNIQVDETCPRKRIIHVMKYGSCTMETGSPDTSIGQFLKRVRQCPQVKFLALYTTSDHSLRGDQWKEIDEARQAFRYEYATEVDFEARAKFLADF